MAEEKKKPEEEKKTAPKAEASKESETAKTAEGEKTGKKPSKAKKKVKRRLIQEGNAYIQASYNNTMVTITDTKGEVVAWSSAGASGFKGAKKATPYAAQVAAENAVTKAKVFGVERVHVFIKGVGTGREQAIRGLQAAGVNIESLTDLTPIAHNGCRPRKGRRV